MSRDRQAVEWVLGILTIAGGILVFAAYGETRRLGGPDNLPAYGWLGIVLAVACGGAWLLVSRPPR